MPPYVDNVEAWIYKIPVFLLKDQNDISCD